MVNYFVLVDHRGVQCCRRGAVLSTAMMEQWIQSNSCFGCWRYCTAAGDWVMTHVCATYGRVSVSVDCGSVAVTDVSTTITWRGPEELVRICRGAGMVCIAHW